VKLSNFSLYVFNDLKMQLLATDIENFMGAFSCSYLKFKVYTPTIFEFYRPKFKPASMES